MLSAARQLREEQAKDPRHQNLQMVQIPSEYKCKDYLAGHSTQRETPRRDGLTAAQLYVQDGLFIFWQHTRWAPVESDKLGASWMEVFAFFKGLGGTACVEEYDRGATQSATLVPQAADAVHQGIQSLDTYVWC